MNRAFIIAEAGVNHNGDIAVAKQLIDVAAQSGADYVKFQTFNTNKVISRTAPKADYQRQTTSADESQYDMVKRLELSEEDHHTLIAHCKRKDIKFLSTAFDEDSVGLLDKLDIDFFKIPSGEITNKPYLQKIASKKKPVIISTGMATLDEIKAALDIIVEKGILKKDIIVLHCNTEYPTPYKDVNLRAMNTIAKKLGFQVGYSDHTPGIEVPIAAVAMGAVCIEKHFTLDRNMKGPDHKASLEPNELIAMISGIRIIEEALGCDIKQPSESERKNIVIARKSIYAAKALKCGHIIQKEDLQMMRPGNGISPMDIDRVIGKRPIKDLPSNTQLTFNDLK